MALIGHEITESYIGLPIVTDTPVALPNYGL